MRIIQLKSSPGVSRRLAPSPAVTPAPEKSDLPSPVPETSHLSLVNGNVPESNLDDTFDDVIAEPGYALPSQCKKTLCSSVGPRTSTPLNGRSVKGKKRDSRCTNNFVPALFFLYA